MRSLVVVVTMFLAACPGDDGPTGVPDAAPDAPIGIPPIAVTFERVGTGGEGPNGRFMFGPGGTLYSLQSSFVEVSTDAGLTWTRKTQGGVGFLVATTTALFAHTAGSTQQLLRSTNGATTFTPLTVPGYIGNNNFMHVQTAGTSLWVALTNAAQMPTALQRSADQGASFQPVTLPGTFTKITLFGGSEGKLYLVGDHHLYRTLDGSAWEDLGQFTEVMSVVSTQAGTALVYTRTAGRINLNRRAAADTTWTTDPDAPGVAGQFPPTIVQRPNGELLRFGYLSVIDASSTEGASWTSVLGAGQLAGDGLYDLLALDTVVLANTFDGGALIPARFTTGATSWTSPTPTTVPNTAKLVDLSFADDGRVVLAGSRQVFTSADNGSTWHRGTYLVDESSPIRAATVTPDGTQIFIGSTYTRRGFLVGDGDSALLPFNTGVVPSEEHVVAATWADNKQLFVTTASDDNTAGTVYDGNVDRVTIFQNLNPFRNEANPQLDPTAGFHGIAACKFVDTYALLIAARQWAGTNAYQDHLLIQYRYGQDSWEHLEPPIGFGQAQSISCTNDGRVALLYRDEFLYVGGWHLGFHAITENTLDGKLLKARFAPDGHLWVLGEFGLWRSSAPIVVP